MPSSSLIHQSDADYVYNNQKNNNQDDDKDEDDDYLIYN